MLGLVGKADMSLASRAYSLVKGKEIKREGRREGGKEASKQADRGE